MKSIRISITFLFGLLLCAAFLEVAGQNISLGLGAGVGKTSRYPGVKVLSIMGVGEKYTFFDEPALAVTSYTGYSRYETLGSESESYNVLTFGAGGRLYLLELLAPERFADKRFQLYGEFTIAFDYVLALSTYYAAVYESGMYLGLKVGGRYFLAGRLGVFGEIGPSPSGFLNGGLVYKY